MKVGFIRLINAVAPGEGMVTLLIDGENMNPKGYRLGALTGGIGLKPGMHTVTMKRDGVEDATTRLELAIGATITVVPYAERIPAADDKPAHWAMRILRLKQMKPESERGATFVSVAPDPEIKVELGLEDNKWSAAFVKRLGIVQLPIDESGGYVKVRIKGKELDSMAVPMPGNYVVVIYADADGALKCLNFRDVKYLTAD